MISLPSIIKGSLEPLKTVTISTQNLWNNDFNAETSVVSSDGAANYTNLKQPLQNENGLTSERIDEDSTILLEAKERARRIVEEALSVAEEIKKTSDEIQQKIEEQEIKIKEQQIQIEEQKQNLYRELMEEKEDIIKSANEDKDNILKEAHLEKERILNSIDDEVAITIKTLIGHLVGEEAYSSTDWIRCFVKKCLDHENIDQDVKLIVSNKNYEEITNNPSKNFEKFRYGVQIISDTSLTDEVCKIETSKGAIEYNIVRSLEDVLREISAFQKLGE